ncbi:hypothetical protein B0A48_00943 [Cryoendolithus antarcticus]|uniref:histone acetyltransferase n=1 Tax=Cryoendolithus antarcticus TaxID=1507870 RepID=A0A1V8TRS4_9PEZI|nr:hypothetical protein B0A48_00943 [Cryoendolithus antarcticus]
MASFTSDSEGNTKTPRLRDALAAALSRDFRCRIRYTHTPAKPCESLFSAPPGEDPERTKLASHFLTISTPLQSSADGHREADVEHHFVFAMEVLVYTTRKLTTLFISKADSTGYLPYRRPSPIKAIATTFLTWLSDRLRHPRKRLVISLFARAQPAYLFPGSAIKGDKHVLTDHQLTGWWVRVLDSLILRKAEVPEQDRYWQGYITVPNFNNMAEVRRFLPPNNTSSPRTPRWKCGDPLQELAVTRGLPETAPPRCLLPRFPDDPKGRFIQDLDDEVGLTEDTVTASPSKKKSGAWLSVKNLDTFWTVMEARQECSSGQVVGFLWLVQESHQTEPHDVTADVPVQGSQSIGLIDHASLDTQQSQSQPSQTSQSSIDSQASSQKRRGRLTGPITARQPRLKGGSSNISATSEPSFGLIGDKSDGPMLTNEGYDCAMQTLLQLDFSSAEEAARSTARWVSDVSGMVGLTAESWGTDIRGTAEITAQTGDVQNGNGAPATNDLGSLVRKKKRKVDDSIDTAVLTAAETTHVNTLVGRKKVKA